MPPPSPSDCVRDVYIQFYIPEKLLWLDYALTNSLGWGVLTFRLQ